MRRFTHEITVIKALPFEPLVPNAETIEAIKAARRGEHETANTVKNLLENLNAHD